MIKEQDLVNSVLKALHSQATEVGLPFHAIQIESGATAIGIPDIYLLIGDTACWIECKRYIPTEPDSITEKGTSTRTVTFDGIARYRPGQRIMLERIARHNQHAITLCISQYMDVYFYKHTGKATDYDALHLNKVKGVTLPYALQTLCDALQIDYFAYRDREYEH